MFYQIADASNIENKFSNIDYNFKSINLSFVKDISVSRVDRTKGTYSINIKTIDNKSYTIDNMEQTIIANWDGSKEQEEIIAKNAQLVMKEYQNIIKMYNEHARLDVNRFFAEVKKEIVSNTGKELSLKQIFKA